MTTKVVSDDFNRGDGSLVSPWSAAGGLYELTVTSNQCRPAGSGNRGMFYNSGTLENDQYVQAKAGVNYNQTGGVYLGLLIRVKASNLYYLTWFEAAGSGMGQVYLYNGGFSMLGGYFTCSVPANATVKVTAVGTAIKGYVNGSEVVSRTDGTIDSGRAGIAPYNSGGAYMDDWEAGNMSDPVVLSFPMPCFRPGL